MTTLAEPILDQQAFEAAIRAVADHRYTLSFTDGTVELTGGCNNYFDKQQAQEAILPVIRRFQQDGFQVRLFNRLVVG